MSPEIMSVIHSHQRQETRLDCPTKPPTMGPNIGPKKEALAKKGKAKTRSMGLQRSEMDPPAQVRGVEPKKPAMKRKASCEPMLGERPAATERGGGQYWLVREQ